MTANYDDQNIFAKILRGEAPCVKLYEDEQALAFMDIMPRGPGHLLVIPKTPARNILDVPAEALAAIMPAVQKLARAAKAALGARRRVRAAVQRGRGRAGGVPPAFPCHPALRGRAAEAAGRSHGPGRRVGADRRENPSRFGVVLGACTKNKRGAPKDAPRSVSALRKR